MRGTGVTEKLDQVRLSVRLRGRQSVQWAGTAVPLIKTGLESDPEVLDACVIAPSEPHLKGFTSYCAQ